jgi:hypothetical protein
MAAGPASAPSAAPIALWCLLLTLAAFAAQELRRFGARPLVPATPSVPSLRDRPG